MLNNETASRWIYVKSEKRKSSPVTVESIAKYAKNVIPPRLKYLLALLHDLDAFKPAT